MSPEQIAEAQLQLSNLQLWVTALAIFLGPLSGVLFTFWFQSRKDKIEAKRRLFFSLMSDRKGLTVSYELAKSVNTIDVVFSNNAKVKGLWHKYYALLAQPPGEERTHTWIELLEAMAKDLSYSSLSQTDLDKFYVPQGHVDDLEFQRKSAEQWLRVLENTEQFLVSSRKPQENKSNQANSSDAKKRRG